MNPHVSQQFTQLTDSHAGILNQACSAALDTLSDFAGQAHSMRSMHVAFGRASDPESVEQLLERMQFKDASLLPNIEIISSKQLKNGQGAFSDSDNTIYLSNALVQRAIRTNDIAGITGVLLEETGHYFDSLLNSQDSAGDEGEIFSKIVQGKVLSSSHLNALKLENDALTLTIDGRDTLVEMSRIETIEFKGKLYQSMRGTDNQIFIRSSTDGANWGTWQDFGGRTSDDPEFEVFDNKLIQSVRGTDNGVYTRHSYDGSTWSQWQRSGATLDAPEMEVFGNKLMQTIRGTDDGIYTRYSYNGVDWNQWQWSGKTLDTPELEVFQNKLFQSVQGADNRIYTRYSYDGDQWFNWVDGGATLDAPELETFGDKLMQSVRGTDNRIYTRYSYDGDQWFNWVDSGATLDSPELESFNGWLYQTVRGTDDGLYTRISRDGVNWTDYRWSGQTLSTPTLAVFKDTLFQAVEGTDNRIHLFNTSPASPSNHGSLPGSEPLWLDRWSSPGDLFTAPDDEVPYYPELYSLSENEWDFYSGDNTRIWGPVWSGETDERHLTPDSVEAVYRDLSTSAVGAVYTMTAGYINDPSYLALGEGHHTGIDIGASKFTPIYSLDDGVVTKIENFGSRGYFIHVQSSSGTWVYGHVDNSLNLQVGQQVNQGQQITRVGDITAFGDHLHLEFRVEDTETYGKSPERLKQITNSPIYEFWRLKNL